MDKYTESQLKDVAVIRKHISGQDISTCPLGFKTEQGEMMLTYAGAVDIAKWLGITRERVIVTESLQNRLAIPKPVYYAVVGVRRGNLTRMGASPSKEKEVAIELAFRNGVRQIIPQQGVKLVERKPQRPSVLPHFVEPSLLTHPNIPKPLHGVNPRSVLGVAWWDKQRRQAYAQNNFCCFACGIHKSKAHYHCWLEAHEHYEINYTKGIVRLKRIVALCHACHNFIHSGRLWMMYANGEIDTEKIETILSRGFDIIKKNSLQPFWGTQMVKLMLEGYNQQDAIQICHDEGLVPPERDFAAWEKWRLLLDGKEYRSPFASIEQWAAHYAKRDA